MKLKYIFFITFLFPVLSVKAQFIASVIDVQDITTSGFTLSWDNFDVYQNTIHYGNTPDLELGSIDLGTSQYPTHTFSGGLPAQLFYVQLEVTNGSNVQKTDTLVYITQSLSSGRMIAYFNQSVDHSFAQEGNEAVHLHQLVDDTLVKYIERAQESIEVAIYNTTSSSSVADYIGALNDAHSRGVKVRVVYNQNTGNTGVANLNPDIPKLISPTTSFEDDIGLMHHKFFVFDAKSSDPNLPLVWTGATNLTTQQINTDANNVIIIQDQSLALTYLIEFNEMWGSEGMTPDLNNSRFGIQKKDNTPHVLNVNGSRVESYFSPSDNTNEKIIGAINQATDELLVNTMLITRNDIANAINFMHLTGSNVAVQVNTEAQSSTFSTLQNSLKGRLAEYSGITGILHHKTMMGNVLSNNNPFVLTGSHNWSSSAELRNDENTLIIYNEAIANQYLQEFMARHEPMASDINANDDAYLITNPDINVLNVSENDAFYFTIEPTIYIHTDPKNGIAAGSEVGFISYKANDGYLGKDSLQYITCNESIFSYCDTAWVRLEIDYELSVSPEPLNETNIHVYPNPANDYIEITSDKLFIEHIEVRSTTGQLLLSQSVDNYTDKISLSTAGLSPGVYILTLQGEDLTTSKRIIIQ